MPADRNFKSVEYEGRKLVAGKTWFDWTDTDIDQRDLDEYAASHPETEGMDVPELYEAAVGTGNINFFHTRARSFDIRENGEVWFVPLDVSLGWLRVGSESRGDAEPSHLQRGPAISAGEVVRRPKAMRE